MKKLAIILLLICLKFVAVAQINKPIKWSYAAKRTSATEGVVYLKADIADGWHIYSVNQKEGGPDKTSFTFTTTTDKNYTVVGKLTEPKPIKKFEEVFGIEVLYFENSVVFTQKIKLNSKRVQVKGKVEFMACTNKECLPTDEVGFSILVK
jgi:DsbC/DsbD-like thiol-disulfide interchange protein